MCASFSVFVPVCVRLHMPIKENPHLTAGKVIIINVRRKLYTVYGPFALYFTNVIPSKRKVLSDISLASRIYFKKE